MSTNVDSISGTCKVNILVDCPCKLSVQGREYDAAPGDVITIEQAIPLTSSVFFIQIKELSSLLSRVASLRRAIAGRLNVVKKFPRPQGLSYERGYYSCRKDSLIQFAGMLDDILNDYSL